MWAAPCSGHALCPRGVGASSSVPEENAPECTGIRDFIIDITLNPLLLNKMKRKSFTNFRTFTFISNKLLPVEILLLRSIAINNSKLVCSWDQGGALSGSGVRELREAGKEPTETPSPSLGVEKWA